LISFLAGCNKINTPFHQHTAKSHTIYNTNVCAKVPWGWTLLCFPEGYVPVEPDPMDDEEVEPWAIDDDAGIYDCVREFHKRYPDPTVDIQLNGKEDSNDNDNGNLKKNKQVASGFGYIT